MQAIFINKFTFNLDTNADTTKSIQKIIFVYIRKLLTHNKGYKNNLYFISIFVLFKTHQF